jgi:glucose-6-phosphate-specific signal transduction histidine kinase
LCNPAIARILRLPEVSAATGRNLFEFYANAALAAEHRELLRQRGKLDVALLDLVASDGAPAKAIARMLVSREPNAGVVLQLYLADVSELELLQRELADALSENRMLSQKYLLAQEEERRHLARELHDEMGQWLNAIKLDAVSIRKYPGELPREVVESAQSIMDVSTRVYDVARGLMERLRPVALDELGLGDALGHLVSEWRRRNPQVECTLTLGSNLDGFDEQTNITVYRVVQECLTNVTRHAQASQVRLELAVGSDSGELTLVVSDNGVGIDSSGKKRSGLGLAGLRERVEALRGRLEILRSAPHGVEVRALIPLSGNAA